ncbi:hypothetical protein D3C76_914960 [compost metagenome]
MRELGPVLDLHLPVELRQRVEVDLAQHWLDGLAILSRVVHENARYGKRQRRGRTHHCCDASRCIALPVRADDHVEARFGPVALANLGKLIGACVIQRIDPEAFAKVRYLEDKRLFVQWQKAGAVHDILI